jgi:4-carboxymuconolactone decarboxylase
MNRLIDIAPDQFTPEQKTIFDNLVAGRGKILGPYKIWIHSPVIADGMERIGTHLNKKGVLSPREVEMGIIIIATHWQSPYVQTAHVREGRRVGLSEDIIEALVAGKNPVLSDAHERGVVDFARALVGGAVMSDAEYGAVETAIGRTGIAEVLVLLGYYTSVALGMKVHQVPIPPA